MSGSSASRERQKRPPSVETWRRLRVAYRRWSGFPADTATAYPGGSPRPDSLQVRPASCETRSGGLASTIATTVDPAADAATRRGRNGLAGGGGSNRSEERRVGNECRAERA